MSRLDRAMVIATQMGMSIFTVAVVVPDAAREVQFGLTLLMSLYLQSHASR